MIRAFLTLVLAAGVTLPAAGWQRLPASPVAIEAGRISVWTGSEMLVYGVTGVARDGNFLKAANAAEAYDPAAHSWRRLADPPRPVEFLGSHKAVWTGKEMLVWPSKAFDPRANSWRTLPNAPTDAGGLVVWTGRELIGWGGGCCGDAFSDGAAYRPATNSWRKLARSPLAGSAHPIGAWTGRELVLFVGGTDPNGKPWPARLARAAAYNPSTNRWRRIAPLPESRNGSTAVWDGREVLVVGGAGPARSGRPAPLATIGFAYNPATNRWRRLAPMPSGRAGAAVVWTGKRVLIWGGSRTADGGPPAFPARGLAYDPKANRWSSLPQSPLQGRLDPAAVWTGTQFVLWGGEKPASPLGTGTKFLTDGAALKP
ncbi:MAG: hypothetical protein QOK13_269 [Gaiellaceae bacterium]|nr:hypothetical protein [Gaiellaceae bacterium]